MIGTIEEGNTDLYVTKPENISMTTQKGLCKFLNSLSLKRIKKDNSVSFLFHALGQEDINFIDIVLTMGH